MHQSWGDLGALCGPLAASAEKAAAEHAVEVTPFKGPSGEHVSAQHSSLVPFPPFVNSNREDGDLHPYHLQDLPMPSQALSAYGPFMHKNALHASKRLLPGC